MQSQMTGVHEVEVVFLQLWLFRTAACAGCLSLRLAIFSAPFGFARLAQLPRAPASELFRS